MTCNEFISRPRPSLAPSDLSFIVKLAKRGELVEAQAREVLKGIMARADVPALSHGGDLLVMLLPEYRRMDLGTKLAAGVLKVCRGKFDSVLFCFFGKNKPARKLSKKLGFELCGRDGLILLTAKIPADQDVDASAQKVILLEQFLHQHQSRLCKTQEQKLSC